MAGHPVGPQRADRRPDRLRQDACGLPGGLDSLVRQGLEGTLADETQVVYVSPLKALSNDIHRNLDEPLAGIRGDGKPDGAPGCRDPSLGADRRHLAGGARPDAPPAAPYRRDHAGVALHPAWLGDRPGHACRPRGRSSSTRSMRWRRTNGGAISPSPSNGSAALVPRRLLRIGLSATQKPIETVAQFLVGAGNGPTPPSCDIIDIGHARARDLAHRGAGLAARSGDVGRGLGAGL